MSTPPVTKTQIQVVYPSPAHDVYDDATFILGNVRGTSGTWRLVINEQTVPVSPQGFFAWKINLHPGMNPVRIQVFPDGGTHPAAEDLFAIHRVPPIEAPPQSPLTIVAETLQPATDIWLSPHDVLTVACLASPDANVTFTVPGLIHTPIALTPAKHLPELHTHNGYLDTREMIFAERHWTGQQIPLKGYYQASIPLTSYLTDSTAAFKNLPITLHLQRNGHTLQKTLPGRLSILKSTLPAILQKDAISRTAPEMGARLTPQKAGTLVFIDALEKDWFRARLNQNECFYLPKDAVQILAQQAVPPARLEAVKIASDAPHTATVDLNISGQTLGACPIQVEVLPGELNRLQVRLYNVQSQCDFIQYPPDNPDSTLIRQVHWRQIEEKTVELWLELNRPLAGYDYALVNGQWRFTLKSLPSRIQDVRVLIDPGHGGPETGATGLNGIREKDLNLTVSRLLEQTLQSEGFQTVMTRHGDQEVSLSTRQDIAVREKADIILSIHHNALPDGRDPLQAIGACTFYYHAFSKPLAETLLHGLTFGSDGGFTVPNYGLFYDSLFIPRIHQALSVLIEIGFFTNPTEFERLINPAFQQEAARRLSKSLKLYFLSISKHPE
jgi:N-acetylmuramoyl-L-alanine amidase